MSEIRLKARYDFKCFQCGHEMSFSPSLSMQQGTNAGHGKCTECGEVMKLKISDDGQTGYSEPFNDDEQDLKEEISKL